MRCGMDKCRIQTSMRHSAPRLARSARRGDMLSLIHAVAGRPWAIRAEIAMHVRGLVAKEGIAGLRHLAELKADVHAFDDDGPRAASRRGATGAVGTVAVVPVIG